MILHRRVCAALAALAVVVFGLVVPAPPAAAVVDDSTPTVGWRPNNGTLFAMARVGDMVVLGGSFTQMVSATGATANRSRLAAISASTGALLPWTPSPDGTVRAIAGSPDGNTVYFGGTFARVGSTARTNLAAVSAATGALASFSPPAPNSEVRALMYYDDSLFVGGTFWRMGTANRGGGAELDPTSGALRAWNPNTNWGTFSLTPAPDGSGIFVGGPFNTVGGEPRDFLAKVSRSTGALLPWLSGSTCQDVSNPCQVLSLVAQGSTLYAGVGGPGGRVTALDVTTGIQRWWTGSDGDVQAVGLLGNSIFAGGHWTDSFNGSPRAGLVALDKFTGAVLTKPSALVLGGTAVWSLLVEDDVLRFGGQFTTVGSTSVARYSSFPILPDPPDTQPPARPGTPSSPANFADSVSLRWSASSDNVATVEYRILRNGLQVGTSSIPFYRDLAVGPSTAYSYSVIAVDAAGNPSTASPTLQLTTPAAQTLLLPRTATWRYWSRGTDPGTQWTSGSFADSSWPTGTGEFGFGDGDESTYISPLGVVHYFRTSFDVSDVSRVSSATMRLLADDGAAVYVNGTVVGRFNLPTGPVTNTTTASTSLGVPAEMTYQTMTIPVSALVSGRNQLAVSVHNNSTASSDISFDAFIAASVQADPSLPAAPTGLSGSTTVDSATLTWTAVSGATSYDVFRSGSKLGSVSSATFTESGLAPNTAYTYTVTAVNGAGSSGPSQPLTLTTQPLPPSAPAGLTVTGTTSSTVSLAWNTVSGATDYVVSRGGTPLSPTAGTTFTDTGRAPSTTYTYTVVARNSGGSSAPSAPVTATTDEAPAPQPPDTPTGLRVTGTTSTTVSLAWDSVSGADDYVVSRDGTTLPAIAATTFTDSGRTPSTSYTYTIVARNAVGSSAPSGTVTGTTTAALVTAYTVSGDVWRANDSGANLGSAWQAAGYNDSAWKSGPSQLGYGDGDEATVLTWGSNANQKPMTVYFRRTFDAGTSVADVSQLALRALIDDGAVVYLNGTEIWRFNLPSGTITSTTGASRYIAGSEESLWRALSLPRTALVAGVNTLAVEVHQDVPSSSDLSFDLELRPVR